MSYSHYLRISGGRGSQEKMLGRDKIAFCIEILQEKLECQVATIFKKHLS